MAFPFFEIIQGYQTPIILLHAKLTHVKISTVFRILAHFRKSFKRPYILVRLSVRRGNLSAIFKLRFLETCIPLRAPKYPLSSIGGFSDTVA